MPAWWSRKWSKSKEEHEEADEVEEEEVEETRGGFQLSFLKSPVAVRRGDVGKSKRNKKKPKSFDDKLKGVPLPRPTHSHSDQIQTFGSLSVSGSSVSSSTSFEDHPISPHFNANRLFRF